MSGSKCAVVAVEVEGSSCGCGQMLLAATDVTLVVTYRVRLNCIRILIQDVSFLSEFCFV